GEVTHDVVTFQGREFVAVYFPVEYCLDVRHANLEGFRPWCFASCRNEARTFRTNIGIVEVGEVVALPKVTFHEHLDGVGPSFQAVSDEKSPSLRRLSYRREFFHVFELDGVSHAGAAQQQEKCFREGADVVYRKVSAIVDAAVVACNGRPGKLHSAHGGQHLTVAYILHPVTDIFFQRRVLFYHHQLVPLAYLLPA